MSKVLAFDVGATNLRYGVFDKAKGVRHKAKVKTTKNPVEQIIEIIKKEDRDIGAIGLGVPGPLDFEKGVILNPPNLPQLKNTPLKKILEQKFNKPVFLDNDANCALLGEKWQGVAKNYQNVVLLTLGTGIGSGILIDGKIYRGATGAGAELGHMIIKLKIKNEKLKTTDKNLKCCDQECEDLEKLIQNDHENQVGYLKIALWNIQKIFEPEVIILGGGWAGKAYRKLQIRAKRVCCEGRVANRKSQNTRYNLKLAKLGEWAGVYGAAKGAVG